MAFLKGFALLISESVAPGARSFSDLDLLVPEGLAEPLFAELVRRDFVGSPAAATEQHLPELRPPGGGSIEIHFALRGIHLSVGTSAAFDDLAAMGSLVSAPRLPGSCFVPSRPLQAAHTLVHAFQQHLLRPSTYPLFRMVADLADLLPEEASWLHLEQQWLPTIRHAVSNGSFAATRDLCESLVGGDRPDPVDQADPARLLDHLLAGSTDRRYAESLRPAYLRVRLSEAHRRGELGSYLMRKIRPFLLSSPRPPS